MYAIQELWQHNHILLDLQKDGLHDQAEEYLSGLGPDLGDALLDLNERLLTNERQEAPLQKQMA